MKKTLLATTLLILAAGCRMEEPAITIKTEKELIPLTFGIGTDDNATKMTLSGLERKWTSDDALSVYIWDDWGLSNENVKFSLTDGAGTKKARFKGLVSPHGESHMAVFYPNSNVYGENVSSFEFKISEQKYDGDYTAEGSFSDYSRFSYMFAFADISEEPDYQELSLKPLTGVIRYEVTSDMSETVTVRNISITDPDAGYPFTENIVNFSYDWSAGTASFARYGKNTIGVTVANLPGMQINSSSGTKYLQMVCFPSYFDNTTRLNVNVDAKVGDRRARFVVAKTGITTDNNFTRGARTRISVPLTGSSLSAYASTLSVRSSGPMHTPVFNGDELEYGETTWADGSVKGYLPGEAHDYTGGDNRTVMDCWGSVTSVKFSDLENITAIDLSLIEGK